MRKPILLAAAAVALFLRPPALPAAPGAAAWKVDPVHSTVLFKIKHLGTSNFYGRFNDVSGTISLDEGDPSNSSVSIKVASASVDTNNEKRDAHLKSADFFNAAEFPEILFQSRGFTKGAAEGSYEVRGDLTLLGKSREISVPWAVTGRGQKKTPEGTIDLLGGETTFRIKRSDFGMTFLPEGLGDDVEITFAVEAVKS